MLHREPRVCAVAVTASSVMKAYALADGAAFGLAGAVAVLHPQRTSADAAYVGDGATVNAGSLHGRCRCNGLYSESRPTHPDVLSGLAPPSPTRLSLHVEAFIARRLRPVHFTPDSKLQARCVERRLGHERTRGHSLNVRSSGDRARVPDRDGLRHHAQLRARRCRHHRRIAASPRRHRRSAHRCRRSIARDLHRDRGLVRHHARHRVGRSGQRRRDRQRDRRRVHRRTDRHRGGWRCRHRPHDQRRDNGSDALADVRGRESRWHRRRPGQCRRHVADS